jgi:hypothetical protein
MKWSDFERFLKAEHLAGKKVTVTIEEVVLEKTHVGNEDRQAPVIYFVGKNKGLVLTPTNQRTLRQMFGDDVAECKGKRVTLQAVPMTVAKRQVQPIRIGPADARQPESAAPTDAKQPPATEEDMPY